MAGPDQLWAYVFHGIFQEQYGWLIVHYHVRHVRSGTAVLALGCTVLLSWASFRWFESPFIPLKDRWTRPERAVALNSVPMSNIWLRRTFALLAQEKRTHTSYTSTNRQYLA
jgi:peptidoglycan/LPS O-acetylase OafA/YrhL